MTRTRIAVVAAAALATALLVAGLAGARTSSSARVHQNLAVSGSIATSTSGTMTSRTVVSPRSKMLSIISASCVVTFASPGSICSRFFSSSRETNWRTSGWLPPASRSRSETTACENATNGARSAEAHTSGR